MVERMSNNSLTPAQCTLLLGLDAPPQVAQTHCPCSTELAALKR